MKKVLQVRDFSASPTQLGNALVVAFRRKATLFLQNLAMEPRDRFTVKVDESTGIVTIQVRLAETEQLVIGDDAGIAAKTQIEGNLNG